MPNPLLGLALGGVAALRRKPKFQDPYVGKFTFDPNENDPELLMRRTRANLEGSRDRDDTVNELARAGLLGSGVASGVLGESRNRLDRLLEDINADSFMKQRQEALDGYYRDIEWRRRKALAMYDSDTASYDQGTAALGGIGESYLGPSLEEYLRQ